MSPSHRHLQESDPRAVVIHLVEDDDAVRAALALLLAPLGCSVQQHADAESFLSGYQRDRSACLILDVTLPGASGHELLEQLEQRGEALPTLVISARGEVESVVRAMRGGAVDFLLKPPDPDAVLDRAAALLAAAPEAAERRMRGLWLRDRLLLLTPREREVLRLLAQGSSTKQAALQLGISHKTAHIHRGNGLKKLGLESPLQLVSLQGLLAQDAC